MAGQVTDGSSPPGRDAECEWTIISSTWSSFSSLSPLKKNILQQSQNLSHFNSTVDPSAVVSSASSAHRAERQRSSEPSLLREPASVKTCQSPAVAHGIKPKSPRHPLRRPHILTPAGLPGCTPRRPQAVWRLVPLTELSPRPPWPFRCPPPCEVLFSFEDLPWKSCLSIDNFCFLWQGQPTFPFSKLLHYSICSFTHSTYTFRAFVTAPGSGETQGIIQTSFQLLHWLHSGMLKQAISTQTNE